MPPQGFVWVTQVVFVPRDGSQDYAEGMLFVPTRAWQKSVELERTELGTRWAHERSREDVEGTGMEWRRGWDLNPR
jgi:hypothetical protein